MTVLYIGNRNYSSWSMRPWLALRWAGISFETRVIPLGGPGYAQRQMADVLAISPTGTVPALHLGSDIITDSLAISEWAAEQNPALWPKDPVARAHARAAVCEMHSGFAAIRGNLPCNIRRRAGARELSPEAHREVARIDELWRGLRARFGSRQGPDAPYLFGQPTIADAFFTPIATRFRTYGVQLGAEAQSYAETLLSDEEFVEWEAEAVQETWTLPSIDEH